MKIMPERMFEIAASMGHTLEVMQIHYTNLALEKDDVTDIREFLRGWGNVE
jgi:hypothetical protein